MKSLVPQSGTAPVESGTRCSFIRDIIDDSQERIHHIQTRFPSELNGYLHPGHAKTICLDDTNPSNDETDYVDSIQNDVPWLGSEWGDGLYYPIQLMKA